MIPLPRTVKYGWIGMDVEAHGRALHMYVNDGQLGAFNKQPKLMRRTFGIAKRTLAKKAAKKAGLPQFGIIGPALYDKMRKANAYDRYADSLLLEYLKPSPPSLVYPQDYYGSTRPTFLHETGGIRGNWALDWIAPPGTPVIAPMAGVVSRTSGFDPASGLHGSNRDVFGWSVYLRCISGFYYLTHFGALAVHGGSVLKVGQLLGYVGDWPHDRGRSHTHCGFTHITHVNSLSIAKIRATAAAPMVHIQR